MEVPPVGMVVYPPHRGVPEGAVVALQSRGQGSASRIATFCSARHFWDNGLGSNSRRLLRPALAGRHSWRHSTGARPNIGNSLPFGTARFDPTTPTRYPEQALHLWRL